MEDSDNLAIQKKEQALTRKWEVIGMRNGKGGWGGGGGDTRGREETNVFTFPTALSDLSIGEAAGTPPLVLCFVL